MIKVVRIRSGYFGCVAVDFQTLEDNTVTIRDRDTAKQARMAVEKLESYFCEKLE